MAGGREGSGAQCGRTKQQNPKMNRGAGSDEMDGKAAMVAVTKLGSGVINQENPKTGKRMIL